MPPRRSRLESELRAERLKGFIDELLNGSRNKKSESQEETLRRINGTRTSSPGTNPSTIQNYRD